MLLLVTILLTLRMRSYKFATQWMNLIRRRLSLSLTRNCFKKVIEEDVSRAKKGYVPSNTARSTKWAVANFESWRLSLAKDLYPEDILLTDDPELLCSCLCKYVLETRKESGEPYPPKSI